jgi:hypothetical protein
MGSISRSNMADEEDLLDDGGCQNRRDYRVETYTEVGEEGIEDGEHESNLTTLRALTERGSLSAAAEVI